LKCFKIVFDLGDLNRSQVFTCQIFDLGLPQFNSRRRSTFPPPSRYVRRGTYPYRNPPLQTSCVYDPSISLWTGEVWQRGRCAEVIIARKITCLIKRNCLRNIPRSVRCAGLFLLHLPSLHIHLIVPSSFLFFFTALNKSGSLVNI
jgi:hypothetical protein